MSLKHLFVLCPPSSGSTLLWQVLQTSPAVSALSSEGQVLANSFLFGNDRWNPSKKIAWGEVEAIWNRSWDHSRPILLEKSPPHLIRALQLQEHFSDSYFIIMVRDPYAFCEGVKRRWLQTTTYYNIARFWIACAYYQIANTHHVKRSVHFTYEDLAENPESTCERIMEFLPELVSLDPFRVFKVKERTSRINNLNKVQGDRLSRNDVFEINLALERHPHIMSLFGYTYKDVGGKALSWSLRKMAVHLSSYRKRPILVKEFPW